MFCRLENIAFHFIWQKQQLGRVISHQNSSSSTLPHLNLHFTLHADVSSILAIAVQVLPPFLLSTHPQALCLNTNTTGQSLWLTGRSTLTISDGPICTSPITGSSPTRTPNPMVGCFCTDTLNNTTPWRESSAVALRSPEHVKPSRNSSSFEWVYQTRGTPLQTADKCGMMWKVLLRTVLERQWRI